MIYVFDTSSLSNLKHFYPQVFTTIWQELDRMVQAGEVISTKEVWNEMQRGNAAQHTNDWLKLRKGIFTTPGPDELRFVAEILAIPHFQALIGERQRLMGTPVADPFVIACAKVKGGTVVTEEQLKPNAAKIPNVCAHFNIPCMNLEQFMRQQGWQF
jgi:hypothetical protein